MRSHTRLICMPALLALACRPLPPRTPATIPSATTVEAPAQAPASTIPDPANLPALLDDLPGSGDAVIALLHTSQGDLRCQLDTTHAPLAVTSFIALATGRASWLDRDSGQLTHQRPFYDHTIVHRVMPDLFIQLGDRSGSGLHGPGWQLPLEPGIPHDRAGLLILARSGAHSSGSQLLLTAAALPALASEHTAIGSCSPVSLIHQLSRLPADASNRPLYPPILHTVTISRGSPL